MTAIRLWGVLRCRSSQTLALVDSIKGIGAPAWSPRQIIKARIPRSHAVRRQAVPLLPGFVFFERDFEDVILGLQRDGDCPRFNQFTFNRAKVYIAGQELSRMDDLDGKEAFTDDPSSPFATGSRVAFKTGPFQGLKGTVLDVRGRLNRIELDAGLTVLNISPFLLEKVEA